SRAAIPSSSSRITCSRPHVSRIAPCSSCRGVSSRPATRSGCSRAQARNSPRTTSRAASAETDMQRHFDEQIAQLKGELLLMSGRSETITRKGREAWGSWFPALAEEVLKDNKLIDRMETDIEEDCIRLLALQQPLARAIRLITSALKISNDLERAADHAV